MYKQQKMESWMSLILVLVVIDCGSAVPWQSRYQPTFTENLVNQIKSEDTLAQILRRITELILKDKKDKVDSMNSMLEDENYSDTDIPYERNTQYRNDELQDLSYRMQNHPALKRSYFTLLNQEPLPGNSLLFIEPRFSKRGAPLSVDLTLQALTEMLQSEAGRRQLRLLQADHSSATAHLNRAGR